MSRYLFGTPEAAIHLMNQGVLPMFEAALGRVPSDYTWRFSGPSIRVETIDELQAAVDENLAASTQ